MGLLLLSSGCWPLISGPYDAGADTAADTDTWPEPDGEDVPEFTAVYAVFGSGFAVDKAGDIVPVVDLTDDTTYVPYVVVHLLNVDGSKQCLMIYDFTSPVLSDWDAKAYLGFEGAQEDMRLSYSECGNIVVLGEPAEQLFRQDYKLSLGKLSASTADFIDSYPDNYNASDLVIGGKLDTPLLPEPGAVSFVGFEVDADMGTDFTWIPPDSIPKEDGVKDGFYVQDVLVYLAL